MADASLCSDINAGRGSLGVAQLMGTLDSSGNSMSIFLYLQGSLS